MYQFIKSVMSNEWFEQKRILMHKNEKFLINNNNISSKRKNSEH